MTPSKRRRQGRLAFIPYASPSDFNPYLRSKKWGADIYARDWQEGWDQAEKEWEEEQAELRKQEEGDDF